MQQVLHIVTIFYHNQFYTFIMKIFWYLCRDHVCSTVLKKVIKRRGQILALYLHMNFSKLTWYKSETEHFK